MRRLKLTKAFTLMESGRVVLATTHDGERDDVVTISWTMVLDSAPMFAVTAGAWMAPSRHCARSVSASLRFRRSTCSVGWSGQDMLRRRRRQVRQSGSRR